MPGTERKLELDIDSASFDVGDDTLFGDVGLLSWSRPSDEADERIEADERRSVGDGEPLYNRALVSLASAGSVETCRVGCDGSGVDVTADVSMVMVGARSRRSGVFASWFGFDDMMAQDLEPAERIPREFG